MPTIHGFKTVNGKMDKETEEKMKAAGVSLAPFGIKKTEAKEDPK